MTKTKWAAILIIALLAGVAFAATEKVERYGGAYPVLFNKGLYIGPDSPNPANSTANKLTRSLGNSAVIDFASTTAGVLLSSSITVTGAQAGDACMVGVPTAAAALAADFHCYVDAADSVKVQFIPHNTTVTTCTLNGASPSTCTATVVAGSTCTATPVGGTAAIAAGGAAVSLSSTTLTVTAVNAGNWVENIHCDAPVDPASGTYFVRVSSSQ